jgi:hypothetical protein
MVSEIKDYVLVTENGRWEQGNVVKRHKRVRAYTAADAALLFKCTSFDNKGPLQRLIGVEAYEVDVHGDLPTEYL